MTNSNIPLYEKIKKDIIKKIDIGFYTDNEKLPSENQLVKIYSVSRITATKALVELSLDGYVYRLQGKGSFVMPQKKRAIKSKIKDDTVNDDCDNSLINSNNPKKIGIIIPENADYHSSSIIKAITYNLKFPEYFCNVIISRYPEIEDYAIKTFKNNGYDAIIVFPIDTEIYSETILELHLNRYPIILLDRIFPGINSSYVTCDNVLSSEIATEYLISLGHTKICFTTTANPSEIITTKRHESFINTMIENNISIGESQSSYFEFNKDTNFEEKFIRNIMSGNITAVIAGNAGSAEELYEICLKHKIKIPQDLSIVSFDRPWFSKFQMTYIEQGSYEMGEKASEIVEKLLSGISDHGPYQYLLKPKLVVKNSTRHI